MKIAKFYLEKWGGLEGALPNLSSNTFLDEYPSRYLSFHLLQSKQRNALFDLVDTYRWYNAQISKDPSKENYINDIRRAWLAAEEVNVYAAEHDQPIPVMHRDIRSLLSPSIPTGSWNRNRRR
ncbi:MAG: hypothetical protein WCC17_19840 [Candidatus Nitrosopolaris sp.]